MNHQESLTAYLATFVGELVESGVTDVVISPGSRSTPLALMMAEHSGLRIHIQIDERAAGFFGLGIAKASKRPVALLCTSGTAAANYFPAIVEANISRVPLIVLTADRPHELRDVGAPQAIDQIHLYGGHVKWFVEMALPERSNEILRYAQTVCARAVATSQKNPAGPVHLNFPFREPLIPQLEAANDYYKTHHQSQGSIQISSGELSLSSQQVHSLASELADKVNGIIVCGPMDDEKFSEKVIEMADRLQFPILADPLSQLRSGSHDKTNIIDSYDTFLRNKQAKEYLQPDLIIRFGSMPVSKALTIFLKENEDAFHYVVDGGAGWRDPNSVTSQMIYSNERLFCDSLLPLLEKRNESAYLTKWKNMNEVTKQHLSIIDNEQGLSEGKLFARLSALLPNEATIFVGNSMPIRDLDSFFHNNDKQLRIMANRGANGIDGIVSTAIGAATVYQPVYLILGDLTFFHDLNGLLATKLNKIPINIILINNNGGGIFSFLPQANHPKHFELLFGTPIDVEYEHVVKMYHGDYQKISDWDHLSSLLKTSKQNQGLTVYEVETARDTNLTAHRELWKYVSEKIENWIKGEEQ